MMKKLFFVAIMAITATIAKADAGDIVAGLQFNYGSKHTMMGFGANVLIEPVDRFRIAPEFMYYFKNDGISIANVNLNFHYLIRANAGNSFYPILGFSYAKINCDPNYVKYDGDHFGANIGVGYEYRINEHFRFFAEQRFQILKDWNQSVTVLGLRYKF